MQISSIVDIVGGKLLNTPAISFITQIHTIASKINDGDLFVAKKKCDINLAIQNGAFAILIDFDIEIIDIEIAWIKVEDITSSQIKLLRFILSNTNHKSYFCDDISFEFLNIYSYLDKNLILLTNNIDFDFEILKNTLDDSNIFSINNKYIKNILPLSTEFIIDDKIIKNLTTNSLFNTTFSYYNKLFFKLKLPYIYINHFLTISHFFKMTLDINKLKAFKYFSPIFINKDFEIVEFGKSNKFILANNNKNLIDNEIHFLNSYYNYAKLVIVENINDNNELFMQIQKLEYNALYIKGKSKEEIETLLIKNKKEFLFLI